MYSYAAYGLKISSELFLPELIVSSHDQAQSDVAIRRGSLMGDARNAELVDGFFRAEEHDLYFFLQQVGGLQASNGTEIVVDALPGAEDRWMRLPLLGTVLGILLHQRGLFVLHASAVEINGGAAVFLGAKGDGKSTMAATLYERGHTLLTDDVVAITSDEKGNPQVLPGFPQFKLWPDSVAPAMGEDASLLPRLAEGYDKCSRLVEERFAAQPVPLRRIYVLSEAESSAAVDSPPYVVPLTPQEAMTHLIAHSHAARFGNHMLRGKSAVRHLTQCAQIVGRVPARWLKRRRSLEALPEVAQLVEDDCAL